MESYRGCQRGSLCVNGREMVDAANTWVPDQQSVAGRQVAPDLIARPGNTLARQEQTNALVGAAAAAAAAATDSSSSDDGLSTDTE